MIVMTRRLQQQGLVRYATIGVLLCSISQSAVADEKLINQNIHLGPATCASSVCHGKLDRQSEVHVWLNEYRIWTSADKHSQAYRTLESDDSKRIATYLGLGSATTAKVCLDCHTDNVPREKRGPKFQISDGVGCEACHGGAEDWIKSHAADGATHADNLARGMYPTETPAARAELCLSCHMGSDIKFASHDIMGAGHPRLSFELEAFTTNQPAHYDVDDDYRERKGEIPGFNLWLTGQVEAARRYVDLVVERLAAKPGLYPEIALYDCHGCHHEMDEKRWTPARGGPGVPPGSLRLQDQHLLIVQTVAGVVAGVADETELAEASAAFVRSGQESMAAVRQAGAAVASWLNSRQRDWSTRQFDRNTIAGVRRALVQSAANDRMSDFNAAEQVYLALESLSYTLGDRSKYSAALDRIYKEVEDDASFNPSSFRSTAQTLQGQF
jgi:hypothetical protein